MVRSGRGRGRGRRGRYVGVAERFAQSQQAKAKQAQASDDSLSEDELEIDLEADDEPVISPHKKAKAPAGGGTKPAKQQQPVSSKPQARAALAKEPQRDGQAAVSSKKGPARPKSAGRKAAVAEAPASPRGEGEHESLAIEPPPTPPPQPLPEISPEQVRQGWTVASSFLRSRLQDSTGSAAATTQLRPSLERLKVSLVTKLAAAIQTPGDNASLLIIGPSGSGKTLALERSIAELLQQLNTNPDNPDFGVVRLSGLVHTEDRAGFQEIARQLCTAFKCHFVKAASQVQNVDFLRDMLKELRKGSKAVLFVLDHFDRFAARSKQALLYTLLDSLQAANMQAAVVGATCRLDAIELMEKRVRSRFSHEKELVLNPHQSSSDPRDTPSSVLRSLLHLPSDMGAPAPYIQHFNKRLEEIVDAQPCQDLLRSIVMKGFGTPRDLVEVASRAVWAVPKQEGYISTAHLLLALHTLAGHQNCQVATVAGLAVLELYLLSAVQRRSVEAYPPHQIASHIDPAPLHIRTLMRCTSSLVCRCKAAGVDACNFEMAWAELAPLRRQGSGCQMDVQSRPAALRAFERLVSRGIFSLLDPRMAERGGQKEFMWITLTLSDQEIREGASIHPSCPSLLQAWLTKSGGAVRTVAEAS